MVEGSRLLELFAQKNWLTCIHTHSGWASIALISPPWPPRLVSLQGPPSLHHHPSPHSSDHPPSRYSKSVITGDTTGFSSTCGVNPTESGGQIANWT